jgi:hypothetical protein
MKANIEIRVELFTKQELKKCLFCDISIGKEEFYEAQILRCYLAHGESVESVFHVYPEIEKFMIYTDGNITLECTNTRNGKAKRLGDFIKIMKAKYPSFKYVNTMIEGNNTGAPFDDYCILVRGVKPGQAGKVLKFIEKKIYMPCVKRDEELPQIVTLQRRN